MLRKLLNKLSESLLASILGLLVPAFTAIFLLTETQMRDLCFAVRHFLKSEQPASPNLLVITVTTQKANELTKVTPRAYLARLVDSVASFKPRVIALDYEFIEDDRDDRHYPDLQKAISSAGNIVLLCLLDLHSGEYRLLSMPPPDLVPAQQTGYVTLESIYEARLQTELPNQRLLPSFAFAIVAAYLFPQDYFAKPDTVAEFQRKVLERLSLMDGKVSLAINYVAPASDKRIATYDADEFLRFANAKNIWEKRIAGKIVLIGSTCRQSDSSDQFETPYGTMFGVEVHANIINNLLTQNYLKPFGLGWEIFLTLVSLGIAAFSLWRLRLKLAVGVTTGWLLIYLITGTLLFANKNLLLPLA